MSLAPFKKCKEEDDEDEEDEETKRVSTKMQETSKQYQEWDLSESEDSSMEQMSPHTQGTQIIALLMENMPVYRTYAREITGVPLMKIQVFVETRISDTSH